MGSGEARRWHERLLGLPILVLSKSGETLELGRSIGYDHPFLVRERPLPRLGAERDVSGRGPELLGQLSQ
jgi:hypothetical protein